MQWCTWKEALRRQERHVCDSSVKKVRFSTVLGMGLCPLVPGHLRGKWPQGPDKHRGPISPVKTHTSPEALFHTPESKRESKGTLQPGGQWTSTPVGVPTRGEWPSPSVSREDLQLPSPELAHRVDRTHRVWKGPILDRRGGPSKHLQRV